jgi:type IX secretion system PorP/SprF family membrane protein
VVGTLVSDRIGISDNIYFTGSYAYRIDFEKFRVAMGLSAEFKRQQMHWDMVNPLIPIDPNLPELPGNKMLPNFGAGLYIDADKFYVGVSTPRLLENKLDYTNGVGTLTTSAKQKRHLYFMGGFIMKINDDVKFKPAALVKYTDNAPLEIDFNTSFLFSERLWLGATFRTGDSFDLTAQIIFKNFRIGYAYDYTLTQQNAYSRGTHEILITAELDNKVKGIYHPRYF